MKYKITHKTTYKYTEPVKLGPQTIKLTPKNARHLMVNSYDLNILPKPSLIYSVEETDGTLPSIAYFSGETDSLFIEHVSEVYFSKYNPFNFLFNPDVFAKVPYPSMNESFPDIMQYLGIPELSGEFIAFVEGIATESGHNTLSFTLNLCEKVSRMIAYTKRYSGNAQPADVTFNLRTGACRDISSMFLTACRYMKIPSRFVSGYVLENKDEPDLHSWVEVYVPGGGWIAFDPTEGLASYGNHVPIAVSTNPVLTLPVTGYFISNPNVQSTLTYSLDYKQLE